MRRRLMFMMCLLLTAAGTPAASHWTTNPYAFQYDMTAYIRLTPAVNQEYELAAFCGNECRGVGKWIKADNGTWVIQMRIRSNQTEGEVIRFLVYNLKTEEEMSIDGSIDFVSQTVAGLPGEPMELILRDILLGDVNGDGIINITDAIGIVNYVLKNTPATFIEGAADVNEDGIINVTDAIGVINKILN